MNTPTRTDTTQATEAIARLIATGTSEQEILTQVGQQFPNLSPAELSAALQEATEAAEKRALRAH